ncbi:MAG: acyl carrier protein [Synergistaceae bacterium]|jgi:acyl carrier protein|nr:acyl carrier protein [Synergistaceae bacterium]
MTKTEFLNELREILQREEPCREEDGLRGYEEWDSLSQMALMAYYSKTFGIKIKIQELKALVKVSDLVGLAGENIK